MVSNRKLDVAENGLLESIPPVCKSSKGSHLERGCATLADLQCLLCFV